jgi:hypothetical protein
LDNREGALAALDSGAVAISPNKLAESELVKRILATDNDEVMPPPSTGKHLSESQKRILQNWIQQGAEYDKHWSFIPPTKSPIPKTIQQPSIEMANPIDQFVVEQLEANGIKPSAEADPITLIRRASLDLIGLPPSLEEVDAFVAASSLNQDDAFSQLIDRLLRSPRYGERWGRWWLDQARYADSNGYSVDAPRQIWKYRDWVIEALNRDLPFDQFTVEQLAGDLLPNASESQIIATGFHRNTQINQEGGIDVEQFRIDSVFDRVATTGTVFLGLTIGCAQCHDHKFDPILQKEYYQLFAFLNNQTEPSLTVYPPELNAKALTDEKQKLETELRDLASGSRDEMNALEDQFTEKDRRAFSKEVQKALGIERSKRTAVQHLLVYGATLGEKDSTYQAKKVRIQELDKLLATGVSTLVMKELPEPRSTKVFIQGDFTRPSQEVQCGTPSVLHPIENAKSQLNRLDLANWIVSPKNPLTSRVIVNRVWQQHFGRGLVETENDFGLQGSSPTHPELLDWLAVEFVEQGWSLKRLHKIIVSSKTYRQSSIERQDLKEKDRDNYLLARQRRLRLDAEIVRDVGLAASGLLSGKMGGAPVYPPLPDGVMSQGQVKREWKVSTGEDRFRRGLYTFVYRATPPPSLNVFDAPEGNSSCTRRVRSNTPLQALTLLNDAAFFEFAKSVEQIIEKEGIEVAFRRCTSRRPRPDEIEILKQLDRLSAARVLLNLDETVTRE